MQTMQPGLVDEPVREAAPEGGLSLAAALRSMYREASGLLHDHLRLAALEAQRAMHNLVLMVGIGIAAALLIVTGWLALIAALVALAVDAGASWPVALFGACIISIAAAVGAGLWIRHLASQLMFVLTLRWLRPDAQSAAAGVPSRGARA
jgi:uncharacterized membrane protein YqjE